MKFVRKFMLFFVLMLVAAGILIGGGGWLYLSSLLPDIDGSVVTSRVKEKTQIIRDKWGVPHIKAKNAKDAYFALGFTLAQEIRKLDARVPIIFITARSQTPDVVKGFEIGANDYIKKPFSMEELVVRIKARLSDNSGLVEKQDSQKNFLIGKYHFNYDKQVLDFQGREKKLTHREAEILRLLCLKRNEVLERSLVLDKVWGDDNFFNARSMDVFITKLRKYLSEDPEVEILNVRGIGYKIIY